MSKHKYSAKSVHFTSASVLEGDCRAPDSSRVSFSFWTRWSDPTVLDGYQVRADGDLAVALTMANNWNGPSDYFISVSNNDGSSTFMNLTPLGVISPGIWYNVLGSLDTNFSVGSRASNMYINDVSYSNNPGGGFDTGGAFEIAFGQALLWDMVYGSSAQLDMADMWIAPGVFIDFTTASNRRKFIDAHGKPVFLGEHGELPTGIPPLVFLSGDASTYATNLGTGGNFQLMSGSMTNAASSPSD